MNEYYVYYLIDPRNGLPFYVGKGKGNRMYDHEMFARNGKASQNNVYLFRKIKKIWSSGLSVLYKKIYEGLEEHDAFQKEIEEEKNLRESNINLCNLVPCGNGGNLYKYMSPQKLEEIKRKISEAGKGRIVSDETRKKLRDFHTGKVLSEETKKKISSSKIGKKMSAEAKKHISQGHKGLLKSEETRRKLSLAMTGKKRSSETKSKLSELAKARTNYKNSNYRPLLPETEKFIQININRPIYWIFRHLPEKASYGRIKRRIDEMKKSFNDL